MFSHVGKAPFSSKWLLAFVRGDWLAAFARGEEGGTVCLLLTCLEGVVEPGK